MSEKAGGGANAGLTMVIRMGALSEGFETAARSGAAMGMVESSEYDFAMFCNLLVYYHTACYNRLGRNESLLNEL